MKKVNKYINFARMKNTQDFIDSMKSHGKPLPTSDDLSILRESITIDGKKIPNRLVVHPLEGFDGTEDGAPTDLIYRRYRRYASGGAGLIWYEAISISDEGKCNPRQMVFKDSTVPEIRRLVELTNQAARDSFGQDHTPYNVAQLTHSGRKSVDQNWISTPIAVMETPFLDDRYSHAGKKISPVIVSDEEIERIVETFIESAVLAAEAGFDSVDIKICHEYLLRELLAAFNRPGKYGGSFENRTRAVFEIINGIRTRVGDGIDICVRLNAYDCLPYPYGWGMVQEAGVMQPDLSEPIKLCNMLVDAGIRLINISTMMPRFQPYGMGFLPEIEAEEIDPYAGTYHLLKATKEIKEAVPGGIFVATGLSWYEQFGAQVGAGGIEQGWFDLAGFGRQAFAYPDFAKDILYGNGLQRSKCCITCDKCYELIEKGHSQTGCVIRDQEIYMNKYRSMKAIV